MVEISSYQYDNGLGGGDGLLTSLPKSWTTIRPTTA